ncbi:Vascular endothelial growth factor receptor 1 [Pseudolycoriella hygida]|uniref:Platelet-derived growth factor receptor-like protein n=1 Tax=Pseudolycoriella hygida TaxID=35572 RepID=A0A9Q0N171_9DIPT|nr:Vascular endothelial growth factor receptor 1 [Pseudolycoriella hygida]
MSSVCLCVILYFVVGFAASPAKRDVDATPTITPYEEEMTGSYNEKKVFDCRSTDPVEWIVPQQLSNSAYFTNDSTITENGADIYESKLTLNNLNHVYVGFYYCALKSKNLNSLDLDGLERTNEAVKFYLFVDDQYDFTVYTYPIAKDKVHAHNGQPVTIPCKPTTKNIKVTLTKYPPHKIISFGKDLTPAVEQPEFAGFDPKYGFRIEKYDISMRGLYNCTTGFRSDWSSSGWKAYELHGDAPIITPANDNVDVSSGDSYQITCQSEEPVTWTNNQERRKGVRENVRIYHTRTQNDALPYESRIELSNINANFAGSYYCKTNASIELWGNPADTNQIVKVKLNVKA